MSQGGGGAKTYGRMGRGDERRTNYKLQRFLGAFCFYCLVEKSASLELSKACMFFFLLNYFFATCFKNKHSPLTSGEGKKEFSKLALQNLHVLSSEIFALT